MLTMTIGCTTNLLSRQRLRSGSSILRSPCRIPNIRGNGPLCAGTYPLPNAHAPAEHPSREIHMLRLCLAALFHYQDSTKPCKANRSLEAVRHVAIVRA